MAEAILFLLGCWIGSFAGFFLAGVAASNRMTRELEEISTSGALVRGDRQEIADTFVLL